MIEEEADRLFAHIRDFSWGDDKRDWTLRERKIDFNDARFILDGPTIVHRSDRKGEVHYVVFGLLEDIEVVIVCMIRGDVCHVYPHEGLDVMKGKNITVVSRNDRRKGKTDWDRLRKLTDEEIEASVADDPDWAEFKDVDWSKAVLVIPPKKKAISIRLDEDVLDYFKKEGAGYQRRMNAVLRSYMQQTRKGKKRA